MFSAFWFRIDRDFFRKSNQDPLSEVSFSQKTMDSGSDSAPARSESSKGFHKTPFYAPRIWDGMRPLTWWNLLRSGGFRLDFSRSPLALASTLICPINTVLTGAQSVLFGSKLSRAKVYSSPIFVLGHWRSGTTLLHELLFRDQRFASPNTFQCFAPHHFLVSEWAFQKFGGWLLPKKRPMDNMATGWARPQEDEFALMTMGLPSPYRRIAFPNNDPVDLNYLDFQNVSRDDIDHWMETLRRFLSHVSYVTGKRLVVKSPTHTGRLGELSRAFPDAKFIHITRDPRALFPSTCRLWQSLDEFQSLQKPKRSYDEYVIECFRRMYASFHRDRESINDGRLIDVRYEDLVNEPVETLENIYTSLDLNGFDQVATDLNQWAATEHKTYKTNRHQLSDEQEKTLLEAWQEYFVRYGYA